MTQPTREFEGFDPRALALLAQMPAWDKDQYQQHKPLLAQGVTAPGLALISTIAQSLDPELTVTARGSVSPLHEHLRRLIDERGAEIAGDTLADVPKPFPTDHPRGDLLRLKGFQVRFIEPLPASVGEAAFARWCIERLEDLQPVHDWLLANLCGGAE